MPSPRTRRLTFGCLTIGVLLMLAIGAAALWFLFPPAQARASGLPVRIRIPSQGARLALEQTHGVLIEAQGVHDLSRVELWVDGRLAAVQVASEDPLLAAVHLGWRPAAAGAHTLIARAFDAQGTTGRSLPIVVETIARPAVNTYLLPATLEEGQTIEDLAAAAGISPQAIADANPELSGDPAPGSVILVPVPADAIPGGAAFDDGPDVPPAGDQPIPEPELPAGFPAPVNLQAAEGLGCEARLTWSGGDGAEAFVVSSFGPGDSDFRTLAELDADQRAYTDIVPLPATYTYLVQASNGTGLTESNLVALEMSDECQAFEVPPDEELTTAEFEALELITEAPFDRLYCYLGLGPARYIRLPADEDEFLTSPDGLVWDIDRHASGIQRLVFHRAPDDPRSASIECWGWQGASLSMLGAAQASWDLGPLDLAGPGFNLSAIIDAFDGSRPLVPRNIDFSVPFPYDLAIPDNDVDCLAHILWFSGEEIEGGERSFMRWICRELTEDTLQWKWSPSEEVALDDLTGFRIFVNRDYGRDPAEQDPELPGWERLGAIGSAVRAYPIPRPPCGTTYGYKVQAFIQSGGLRAEPAGFDEPARLVPVPERASEPSRAFTLTGGDCPNPRVLVEISLETVTVGLTKEECWDFDFECNNLPLQAYGQGAWFREDAAGNMTEIASMEFWNQRAACDGGPGACITINDEGTVLAHNAFHLGLVPIRTCTPEGGCTGFGNNHHRFQTWLEDGDTVKFLFNWWDYDDVSGDDIWCGTTDDGGWLPADVRGPGVTSFALGPFAWETWAGFDHRHADDPWDNDEFHHQDAECEIDISVTGLEVEGVP